MMKDMKAYHFNEQVNFYENILKQMHLLNVFKIRK